MNKSETTIEDLARMAGDVAMSVDDLATITKKGFDRVDERFDVMETRMSKLETGQQDTKLKLDNVAHRFELKDLEDRVTHLEKKAKFA